MSDPSHAPAAPALPFGEAGAEPAARRAAEALEAGRVVAIPTETVYGLAARADDASALARLRAIKTRGQGQALTWHVGRVAALDSFPRVSPMARRLAQRYWPGPVTLVLPGVPDGLAGIAQDGWTGARLPAHAGTARLLAQLPFPVAATSANRRGAPPLNSAVEIAREFAGEVDCVLDSGAPRLAEPSLVLRVGPGHFELLRAGLVDLEALRACAGLRIWFVCTGNTCRSPMAALLARRALSERLEVDDARLYEFGFEVDSAGVAAGYDAPISEHAARVLAELSPSLGAAARAHRAQPAIAEPLARADRVYALTRGHLEVLRSMLPPDRARQAELLDPDGGDVPDPIGSNLSEYRRCRDHLAELIGRRLDEWC